MPRSRSREEFPGLSVMGVYAANIRGDGNCLFNALSDQLYGHQNEHAAIRARVVDHMRANTEHFKSFVNVQPGGGLRRNPKRKNAGAFNTPPCSQPSQDEIDIVFERRMQSMADAGTYGDHMEIAAFCAAYDVNVLVYQENHVYAAQGSMDASKGTLHIAYHTWEHYSSIRNLDGPHEGLPYVVTPDSILQHTVRLCQPTPSGTNSTKSNSTQGSFSIERENDAADDEYEIPAKRKRGRLGRGRRSEAGSTDAKRTTLAACDDDDKSSNASSAAVDVARPRHKIRLRPAKVASDCDASTLGSLRPRTKIEYSQETVQNSAYQTPSIEGSAPTLTLQA